jgi:hypothetical protein
VHQVALQIYKAIEQFTIIQDNNQHQWQQ